jgi:isopenicillin N synthase-like dioxygenase
MHRVVHTHNQCRHSIATFVDPRFDAHVPTLKEAIPEGETPRYPPGCYGDTVLSKLKSFYDLTDKTD